MVPVKTRRPDPGRLLSLQGELSNAENNHAGAFLTDSFGSWFVNLTLEETHQRPQAIFCTESKRKHV